MTTIMIAMWTSTMTMDKVGNDGWMMMDKDGNDG